MKLLQAVIVLIAAGGSAAAADLEAARIAAQNGGDYGRR